MGTEPRDEVELEYAARIAKAKARIAELEGRCTIDDIEEENMGLRGELDAANARADAAEQAHEYHRKLTVEAQAETNDALAALAAANARIAELEEMFKRANEHRHEALRDKRLSVHAANARIAELEADRECSKPPLSAVEFNELASDLEKANARIAELEAQQKQLWADWLESGQKSKAREDAANARADANFDAFEHAQARADAAEKSLLKTRRQRNRARGERDTERAETARLRARLTGTGEYQYIGTLEARLAAATELLLDWENYDPDDEEGSSEWSDRRDRFLAQPAPAKEEP